MKEKERLLDKNNMILRLEKLTQESICKSQISRRKLSKKRSLQERGITLIALVVTIIILLILAGVTLNIALSDGGLFSKTQEAADKYKQAQSDEEEMIRQIATQMYSEYVGAEVTGYDLKDNTKNTYTATTDETGYTASQTINRNDMTWKIWDFDGNILRLIGKPTTDKIYLQGAKGYNNGIKTLDKICDELYSNKKTGVSVTNLKRSDIQKVSTYDYTNYKHQKDGWEEDTSNDDVNTVHFGESKDYTGAYCPEMWDMNDKNWTYTYNGNKEGADKECILWEKKEYSNEQVSKSSETSGKINVKESYYAHAYTTNDFVNDSYFYLIFGGESENNNFTNFWIGTRFCHIKESCCSFGLASGIYGAIEAKNVRMDGQKIFSSDSNENNENYQASMFPIVTIDLNASKGELTKLEDTNKFMIKWNT